MVGFELRTSRFAVKLKSTFLNPFTSDLLEKLVDCNRYSYPPPAGRAQCKCQLHFKLVYGVDCIQLFLGEKKKVENKLRHPIDFPSQSIKFLLMLLFMKIKIYHITPVLPKPQIKESEKCHILFAWAIKIT